jgi:putative endonuclease
VHFVYVVRCADGSLYTGYAKDTSARVATHNSGKGARYTAGRRPVQLVYSESFESVGDALRREHEIKRWPKSRKEALVVSQHPQVDRSLRRRARLVAAALRAGRRSANDAFDGFLPQELRDVSDHYWTPLAVVQRAAAWLRDAKVRTVVDIGSGAGKFCIAGALLTRCHFIGLEQRASLVESARTLAETFGVDERVTFVNAPCTATNIPAGDAYYLFNPFGAYHFASDRFAEPNVVFTRETQTADIAAVTHALSRAPAGTIVITYNGFGGRFPPGYVQLDAGQGLPGTLRLWKKQTTLG